MLSDRGECSAKWTMHVTGLTSIIIMHARMHAHTHTSSNAMCRICMKMWTSQFLVDLFEILLRSAPRPTSNSISSSQRYSGILFSMTNLRPSYGSVNAKKYNNVCLSVTYCILILFGHQADVNKRNLHSIFYTRVLFIIQHSICPGMHEEKYLYFIWNSNAAFSHLQCTSWEKN